MPPAHGDTVVDSDGIELFGHATSGSDFTRHQLPQILEDSDPNKTG